jgi:hypothetical protein
MSERESNPRSALVTRLLPLLLLLALPSLSHAQFTFATNSDGLSLTLTKYDGAGGAVVIPSTTNGLPVRTIGEKAFISSWRTTGGGGYSFAGHSNVTSVSIPSTVTSIGDFAFAGCERLSSVSIPASVVNIGKNAFQGCTNLADITIPSSVTNIGEYSFMYTGLTNIAISDGVTSIGRFAFWFCRGLTSVTIPASVTNIGAWTFKYCTNLKGLYFKGNAPSHGVAVFAGVPPPLKVYYVAGTTGWGPTFIGRPTALWEPE